MVKGSCLTRHETKDFAADMVALLRGMKIPVIWTLSAKAEGNTEWRSPVEVLKQLVMQILHLNQTLLSDQSSALNAAQFQSANTELDWFQLLGRVLKGLRQLYIVIDADVLRQEFSSDVSWPQEFLKLFEELKSNSPKTAVKAVLISFGSSRYMLAGECAFLDDKTIKIDRDRRGGCAVRRRQLFRSATRSQGSEGLRPFLLQSKPDFL